MSDLNGPPVTRSGSRVHVRRYAPWCKQHTAFLLRNMQLGKLWEEKGLVGDVIVRLTSSTVHW